MHKAILLLLAVGGGLVTASPRTQWDITSTCCPDIGCFSISWDSGFAHMVELPSCLSDFKPNFYLWRSIDTTPQKIDYFNLNASIDALSLDMHKELYVLVHGFGNKWPRPHMKEMRIALMAKGHNVLIVDWNEGSAPPNYFKASANTRTMGAGIARILTTMIARKGLNKDLLHLIGHSLGAHVVGFIGARVPNIHRIVGLDPADPLFQDFEPVARLDPTDGPFVQVIHTNGADIFKGGAGAWETMGHIDFYANGGLWQPGCPPNFEQAAIDIFHLNFTSVMYDFACSHDRSMDYFTQSVKNENQPCQFQAYPCTATDDWLSGKCLNTCKHPDCPIAGYPTDADTTFKGTFFFGTRSENIASTGGYCGLQTKMTLQSQNDATGWINITMQNENIKPNNDFMMFQGEEDKLAANTPKSVAYIAPWQMSIFTKAKLFYQADKDWYWPWSDDQWTLDQFSIIDQNSKTTTNTNNYNVNTNQSTIIPF